MVDMEAIHMFNFLTLRQKNKIFKVFNSMTFPQACIIKNASH